LRWIGRTCWILMLQFGHEKLQKLIVLIST
jgi:hypothetical protein